MTRVGRGLRAWWSFDVTQKENFITMQPVVMFADVHCGNYSSQTQEEKTFTTVLIHWHHVRGKHTHLKWHRMENCPQSPSGLGPAQYQISTFHEQYSCPHFKSLILLFFFSEIYFFSPFFLPCFCWPHQEAGGASELLQAPPNSSERLRAVGSSELLGSGVEMIPAVRMSEHVLWHAAWWGKQTRLLDGRWCGPPPAPPYSNFPSVFNFHRL